MEPNTDVSGEQVGAAASVETAQPEPIEAQSRQVPLEALQAQRAENQRLHEKMAMIEENMRLMMSKQSEPLTAKKDEFDGLDNDDVLTVGEFKKAISNREKQYQMSIEELRMYQKHPDYHEVVTKYLPEVLKNNPSLVKTLNDTNDYQLAYHLAKNSDAYKQSLISQKQNADAQRIVENANRSGSLASVGQNSPMSNAKRYKDMSNEEFMRVVQKNRGYV